MPKVFYLSVKEELMLKKSWIPYRGTSYSDEEMEARSRSFYEWADQRRSLRSFSDRPVPRSVIESIIRTASTAPSGAHKQPWRFCAVSDPALKKEIRMAAEAEERENYSSRMSERWKKDLEPLGTDWQKAFLETAPWLIVVFKEIYKTEDGVKKNNYYVNESVGLACGFLLMAIHHAGLTALTHTPSPMNFLSKILGRPANERPFLLIPVGHPAPGATVPDLQRKALDDIACFFEEE